MSKTKKKQALDGMRQLGTVGGDSQPPAVVPTTEPVKVAGTALRKNNPCRIPEGARQQLRDLAYHHHPKSANDFMIQGLDMMFSHYGLKTIESMEAKKVESIP